MIRVGYGYDLHRLAKGRKLVLGGVTIPHDKGLDGHSDADVLLHAIIDALLGAAALGDIGTHFPDTASQYKDADSRVLLRSVADLLAEKGHRPGNVDVTVVAEKPKLAPHIEMMRANVAEDLSMAVDKVSIKATTSEQVGIIGREEAMCAMATCLIFEDEKND
ncbi:2-C-methyl-D-erythritol 2,4-cyclodiphosphate synthase [Balneolales bacterium ANBcel1]|nr:2-C-methyl-D-erythritol 2,4-cyclodiphosphate synthase [Balneolales bacterium ANBcel1]